MRHFLNLDRERLHFAEIDGRTFAVMAYSPGDAYRQALHALLRAHVQLWIGGLQ